MTKTDFDNSVSSLDSKIAANKTKNESIENEIKKLKALDLSYFIGKSHFEEDGTQNYLVFRSLNILKLLHTKNVFHRGNLKDYLAKLLSILVHLIIVLLH